jgi:hemolysin activation/secretion protein
MASGQNQKLSSGLRKRVSALIGNPLNLSALDDIAKRLRREFAGSSVSRHVLRGDSPEYVKVVFEVGDREKRFEVFAPKALYDSKEGWSGELDVAATAKPNVFTFGLVSDNDLLSERFTGLRARYENKRIGTDAVHLRFEFDSYHEQWNGATLAALAPESAPAALNPQVADLTSGPYRTRQNFEPTLAFYPAKSVTLSVGVSFERFQQQYPTPHTEAANAAVADVSYHRQLEGLETEQDLAANYGLRSATNLFDTDYVYARHRMSFRYRLSRGRHVLTDELTAGILSGRAPLFERFVLGDSSTLRGWNRFDIDPLGGNRMIHNSVDYRYGVLEVFYDAGAVWDSGQTATPRHGIGIGLREGVFALAVAFPIRNGRADPVFMMGMNY